MRRQTISDTPKLKSFLISLCACAFVGAAAVLSAAPQTPAQTPELVVQDGHRAMIRALSLSSDNRLLASAGADRTIIVWNVATGEQMFTLTGHAEWVLALAFSPDKKYLASGSYDGVVKVWNLTGKRIEFEISQPYSIASLAFNSDGSTLVIASADKVIKLWDMKAGKMKPPLEGHTDSVTQAAFHPSMPHVLVSSSLDKTLRLWNLETGKSLVGVSTRQGFTGFALSPDGLTVAISATGGTIAVVELLQGSKLKSTVIQPQDYPRQVPVGIDYRRWRMVFDTSLYPAGNLTFVSDTELAFVDGFSLSVWDLAENRKKLSKAIDSGMGTYGMACARQSNLLVYTDGLDIKLLDLSTQKQREFTSGDRSFQLVTFTADGKTMLALFKGGGGFWNARKKSYLTVEETASLFQGVKRPGSVRMLTKGGSIDIGERESADIVLKGGKTNRLLKGHTKPVKAVAISPDETILVSGDKGRMVLVWDLNTLKVIRKLAEGGDHIQFSPDGKLLAITDKETHKLKLWKVGDWAAPHAVIDAWVGNFMLFSPDSEILAAYVEIPGASPPAEGEQDERLAVRGMIERNTKKPDQLRLWKTGSGELLHSFDVTTPQKDFDLDSMMSVKANFEPFAYTLFTGMFDYHTVAGPLAFTRDSKFIAAGIAELPTAHHQLKVWNTTTGELVHTLAGHAASIRSAAFSPDGKVLASASWDSTLKLWSVETGKELATVVPFVPSIKDKMVIYRPDGQTQVGGDEGTRPPGARMDGWVIYTPDGRFDTSHNLNEVSRLRWIWPTDPLNPLSVRVFMRDYYEPRLLQKILAGEPANSVRDLSTLNRAQPAVSIKEVKPDTGGTVQVTLEVANTSSSSQTAPGGAPLQSGVFDARVLRDGQLVASSANDESVARYAAGVAALGSPQGFDERELALWRTAHEIRLGADGRSTLTLRNIKLPRRANLKEVRFSAYAFNSDRIPSEITPPHVYKLPPASSKTKRRAYVITVGVDANQSGWHLNFTAASAAGMRDSLRGMLSKNYEVTTVSLLSTLEPHSFRPALEHATKENIRTVLDILAGRPVEGERRSKVPDSGALSMATPDDLIVLYIASHGYADPRGNFYVIPYDTGSPSGVTETLLNSCLTDANSSAGCAAAGDFLKRSISSDDLAAWWRNVDAGEMVMILDSCHSAAVPGRDFKPRPLGDRGFGQLAYDKGMFILAATQPDKPAGSAWRKGARGTLLSSALIRASNASQQQTLSEWLEGADPKVPELFRELYPEVADEDFQLPLILNFMQQR